MARAAVTTPVAMAIAMLLAACNGSAPVDASNAMDAALDARDATVDAGSADVWQLPTYTDASSRTDPNAVHVVGRTFRDGQGRQLLFRGFNIKVPGVFDVTFTDGRLPVETFPDFTDADALRLEQWGFNVIRLTVNWSGLEPFPLQYNATTLQRIDQVVAEARMHHFYVLLDMHQDGYSKEIGEDGAPLWAITPPPTMLLGGPLTDETQRRLSTQALQAGFSFFDGRNAQDGRPLQEAFIGAVEQMTLRYAQEPAVLGYEAFNEPIVFHSGELDAFHARIADALHTIDRDAPLLFEPVGSRNQTDMTVVPTTPWAHGRGAYAPHIYTGQFSIPDQMAWASMDPAVLAPSMAAANNEATGWGTPMFVTEFGCDQTLPQGPLWMQAELDLQDQYLTSSTIWAHEPGNWSYRDENLVERPVTVRIEARMFPRAVAGDLLSISHSSQGEMTVHYRATAATAALPNEVGVSADVVSSYQITCDGAPVTSVPATGRATFVCPGGAGEHVFEVVGTPVM